MDIQSINIFKKGVGKSLGSLETSVMETLWNTDEALSARQVTDALNDASFNAISTVLNRLEKKGLLKKIASGKRYAFEPTMNKKEYCYSIFSSGLASLLGDSKLLSAAGITGDTADVDDKTMSLLEEFLKQHDRS